MPRIAATTLLLVAVLASGTACGGDSNADAGAEPGASGPASASVTTSVEPGDVPSRPAVEPAAGVRLALPLSTVRAPEGWTRPEKIVRTQVDAGDDDTSSIISLGEAEAFGSTMSADELADASIESSFYSRKPRKLPLVELDGVEAYHLAGKVERSTYLEEFGVIVDDQIVTLGFDFSLEVSPAERREIVDSVVASFRWR